MRSSYHNDNTGSNSMKYLNLRDLDFILTNMIHIDLQCRFTPPVTIFLYLLVGINYVIDMIYGYHNPQLNYPCKKVNAFWYCFQILPLQVMQFQVKLINKIIHLSTGLHARGS